MRMKTINKKPVNRLGFILLLAVLGVMTPLNVTAADIPANGGVDFNIRFFDRHI